MVSVQNLVCGRCVNFIKSKNNLTLLSFGCLGYHERSFLSHFFAKLQVECFLFST